MATVHTRRKFEVLCFGSDGHGITVHSPNVRGAHFRASLMRASCPLGVQFQPKWMCLDACGRCHANHTGPYLHPLPLSAFAIGPREDYATQCQAGLDIPPTNTHPWLLDLHLDCHCHVWTCLYDPLGIKSRGF